MKYMLFKTLALWSAHIPTVCSTNPNINIERLNLCRVPGICWHCSPFDHHKQNSPGCYCLCCQLWLETYNRKTYTKETKNCTKAAWKFELFVKTTCVFVCQECSIFNKTVKSMMLFSNSTPKRRCSKNIQKKYSRSIYFNKWKTTTIISKSMSAHRECEKIA